MIARFATVNITGLFFLVTSYSAFVYLVVDFGMTPIVTREVSKHPEKFSDYISGILTVKACLLIPGLLLGFIVVQILYYPQITKNCVYITMIGMALDSLYYSVYGVIRAKNNMFYESLGLVIGQMLTIALGGYFIYSGLTIYNLLAAYVSHSVFNLFYSFFVLKRYFKVKPKLKVDPVILKTLFFYGAPLVLVNVFMNYNMLDLIILSKFSSEFQVGLYSIPYKLISSIHFIPIVVTATFFPIMSSFSASSKQKLIESFGKGCFYLAIVIFPATIAFELLAPDVIQYIFGENYVNSLKPLQILILSLIPMFFVYPLFSLLVVMNKQSRLSIITIISALTHILICFYFVPKYHSVGIAFSALVSNSLMMVLSFLLAINILGKEVFRLFVKIFKLAIMCCILMLPMYFTTYLYSDVIRIVITGLYLVAVILVMFYFVERKKCALT